MKLKMLTSMAGNDFSVSNGDVTERFTGAEAERLIAAGYAERIDGPAEKAETTSKKKTGETR